MEAYKPCDTHSDIKLRFFARNNKKAEKQRSLEARNNKKAEKQRSLEAKNVRHKGSRFIEKRFSLFSMHGILQMLIEWPKISCNYHTFLQVELVVSLSLVLVDGSEKGLGAW